MIKTSFFFSEDEKFTGYRIEGHSLLSIKDNGSNANIICAAVSSVVQFTTIGLISVIGLNGEVNSDNGLLELILHNDKRYNDKYDVIRFFIDTLIITLQEIRDKYPREIEINFLEVKKDGS